MKKLAYLDGSKYRRLYKDIVRKSLERAEIRFQIKDTKFGSTVLVSEEQFEKSAKIILSIPHNNPSYNNIPNYIK